MFIENKQYKTDLVDIHNLRYLLFSHLYSNPAFIQNLTDIISRNIECLSVEYSPSKYMFTIKIKKTSMRKFHGFDHNPNFYYQLIPNIFLEFIKTNEQIILECLRERYDNPIDIINQLYANPYILSNICQVSCIADNILVIKL